MEKDILVTLKINDTKGNLLHMTSGFFETTSPCTLEEFIEHYGDDIEEYLLSKINFTYVDAGDAVLRVRYVELKDDDGTNASTTKKAKDALENGDGLNEITTFNLIEIHHRKKKNKHEADITLCRPESKGA